MAPKNNAFGWVKMEIDNTMETVRSRLEDYGKAPHNGHPLQDAGNLLHQLQGILQMLELYGPALFAEEMEQTVVALLEKRVADAGDTYEVLIRAVFALESYLERVEGGETNTAIVLLPLLNDLRAARDAPLLTETALFQPDLSVAPPTPPAYGDDAQLPGNTVAAMRPYYQAALLAWYRNAADLRCLTQLGAVTDRLQRLCYDDEGRRFWWVAGGVIEALAHKGLEAGISVKLLLGKVDRQLKHQIDQGEACFVAKPPVELSKNLLFYVARAESNGPKVKALKDAFDLERVLPSAEKIAQSAADLTGARTDMLHTIAETLKEGILLVKATLDGFMRSEERQTGNLRPAVDTLKHTADTLSVLGVGRVRRLVMEQIEALAAIIEGRGEVSESGMMQIAQALLHVEAVLDHLSEYVGLEKNKSEATGGEQLSGNTDAFSGGALGEAEYRLIVRAAVNEAAANLTEVKNGILAFVTTGMNQRLLSETPRLLQEVQGALTLLSLRHATALVDTIRRYIDNELLDVRNKPVQQELDLLAEAIVGLEYFLEAVAENRPPYDPILAMTRRCLTDLGYTVEPPAEHEAKHIPVLDGMPAPDEQSGNDAAPADDTIQPAASASGAGEQVSNVVSLPVDDIDADVIEIFVDEARDALTNLKEQLYALRTGRSDTATYGLIRHAFHILKGSGRIAGAFAISDFAKAFEEFVNDLICGVIAADDDALNFLQESYPVLAELIANFSEGRSAPRAALALAEQARELRRRSSATLEASAPTPADAPQAREGLDDVMHSIEQALHDDGGIADEEPVEEETVATAKPEDLLSGFLIEGRAGLDTIRQYLNDCRGQQTAPPVPEDVLHTVYAIGLNARIAKIDDIAELAELLENYIRKISGTQVPATMETLEILADFVETTNDVLNGLEDRNENEPSPDEVQARDDATVEEEYDFSEPLEELEEYDFSEALAGLEKHAFSNKDQLVESNDARDKPPAAVRETAADDDADDQTAVMELFLEEATELMEALEETLQEDMTDAGVMEAMQRNLHTFKGCARMAGVTSVGDLCHALEDLLGALLSGRLTADRPVEHLLGDAIDRLTEMMDGFKHSRPIAYPQDLIDDIGVCLGIETTAADKEEATHVVETPVMNEAATPTSAEVVLTPFARDTKPTPGYVEERLAEVTKTADAAIEEDEAEDYDEIEYEEEIEYNFDELVADDSGGPHRTPSGLKKSESVRIAAELLDNLVNYAGEENVLNRRVEEQLGGFRAHLKEMENTVDRLRGQLRDFETELENQGVFFTRPSFSDDDVSFDALELERYSETERLAKGLTESLGDLSNIQGLLLNLTQDTDTILQQQVKVHKELHESLIGARMVPFAKQAQRLQRIVRQTAAELHKQATLHLEGTQGKLDRAMLDRMMGPLEHIIRNAIAHGIEAAPVRQQQGKTPHGNITISLTKEGSENVLQISDDGAGVDIDAVRRKALEVGLIKPDSKLSEDEILHLILEPGFSTAEEITQVAGRGIGMDVVNSEILNLGGTLFIRTTRGHGTTFTLRLPFTMAMNRSLLVGVGENIYAIPSINIDSVEQVDRATLEEYYRNEEAAVTWRDQRYTFRYLGALLETGAPTLPREGKTVSLVLIRSNEYRLALHVDELLGSREIMVRSAGAQLNTLRGVSGATILGDGRVVLILDIGALLRSGAAKRNAPLESAATQATDGQPRPINVLVVDDSITVRKVTERFLSRHNISVASAKDGLEAMEHLEGHSPDAILLDIEMPRMDGFEVAARMRRDERFARIPIIMITSRTGRKHKEHALKIGVDRFLGKPYQETELLEHLYSLTQSGI